MCGLGCYYEAGVGVVVLKDRDDLLTDATKKSSSSSSSSSRGGLRTWMVLDYYSSSSYPYSSHDSSSTRVGRGSGGVSCMSFQPSSSRADDEGAIRSSSSSSSSSSFVLTGHDDGCVRLWDAGSPRGAVVPCAATLDVVQNDVVDGGTTPSSRRVTRVLFLDQYVDPASCEGRGGAVAVITPPFVVGTDMNHTVALWSSFRASAGGGVVPPTRLRVFGLRRDGVDLSSASRMTSLEICPAPYRPPSPHVAPGLVDGGGKEGEDDVAPPSSFVLMAERDVGVMHALHIDTKWAEGRDGDVTVAVAGFDYVTTLNVVYPVYSFCVAPQQAAPGRRSLAEERDVDLCCLQSKAVQMLTLAAGMCAPPAVEGGTYRGSLAPGITLLGSSALAESCDGGDDGGDEDADEDEEEEEDRS